ncbi:hypothetical protein LCGC14_2367520, partial [marine sediment metagenome]
SPAYVCITCTTSLYFHAMEIARLVKQRPGGAKILVGGPHVSAVPEEAVQSGCFDYVFVGEAELSFASLLQGQDPATIDGLAFGRDDGSVHLAPRGSFLKDLDEFPYPDYGLFDLPRYKLSRLHARQNPTVWIETSRGCPYDCGVCSKQVHGLTFRTKSARRVLDEIEHLAATFGVREFHIADDCFGANRRRAAEICDGLIERDLGVTWSCTNGIRVDSVTQELLLKMRQAGCHRVGFGIETGSQEILDSMGKRISLEQVERAVGMARKAGIETFGFFMLGFPDDTEQTMQSTIRLARKLPLDLAKASVIMPFPGCAIHEEYARKGLLSPPGDYRNYNVNLPARQVYRHPSLDWDVIEAYHRRFFRSFYFNPAYLLRRLVRAIKNRTLLVSIRTALSIDW